MNGVLGILIFSTLISATPLICAALGGLFSERSGVVNIGLEGMMTSGAFTGTAFILLSESALGNISILFGIVFGILGGMLFAILHALLSIKFKIDQIISGTVINILALALAVYLSLVIFGSVETKRIFSEDITFFGGQLHLITIFVLLLVPAVWFVLNKLKWGRHVMAVGENPQAADAMGINVIKIRYQAVILSGALAGLAGMAIVLTTTSNFSATIISGKGFIALAVLVFGRWKPKGIFYAGLFFGLTTTLGILFKLYFPELESLAIYFDMFPYIMTIVALVLFSRKTVAPSALGEVYDKEVR